MECATTSVKTNTNKTQQTSTKKFQGYGAAARAWCGNGKYN